MRELIDIADNDLLEEDAIGASTALQHVSQGMFDQWVNDEVGLIGGWRSGSSPTGYLRVMYTIVSVPEYEANGGDSDAATYGTVEVYRNASNQLAALINIKLDKAKRKAGIGGQAVRGLVSTYPGDFVILDIRKPAVGFWKKMGCEFYTANGKPVEKPGAHDKKHGILIGVIRKAGSNTPLGDLPGFFKPRLP